MSVGASEQASVIYQSPAQHAHPADRFARDQGDFSNRVPRSRRLMRNPFGAKQVCNACARIHVVQFEHANTLRPSFLIKRLLDLEMPMFSLRPLRWPADRELLLAFDTSFSTDRVYRVRTSASSFVLEERLLTPVLYKAYDLAADIDTFPDFDHVSIVDGDSQVAGMAALKFERWNQRAMLAHLYVHPNYRRRGIGNALIADAIEVAQNWRARCVWLETQNVNYPAIQFYQRLGFQWCGLDMALYDGAEAAAGEIALFFTRPLR